MQHQEMIQYSHLGLISRICIFSLVGIITIFAVI